MSFTVSTSACPANLYQTLKKYILSVYVLPENPMWNLEIRHSLD